MGKRCVPAQGWILSLRKRRVRGLTESPLYEKSKLYTLALSRGARETALTLALSRGAREHESGLAPLAPCKVGSLTRGIMMCHVYMSCRQASPTRERLPEGANVAKRSRDISVYTVD